jgi:hypothetical protein
VVVYAVILPIPLMAPVCEERQDFYVKDGIVTEQVKTSVQGKGKVCGPLQAFFTTLMGFGQGGSWCV